MKYYIEFDDGTVLGVGYEPDQVITDFSDEELGVLTALLDKKGLYYGIVEEGEE